MYMFGKVGYVIHLDIWKSRFHHLEPPQERRTLRGGGMAVGCLPPPLVPFASSTSYLPNAIVSMPFLPPSIISLLCGTSLHPGACYLPDVQAPTASLLPLVFPLVCFCFSLGSLFCGSFAPSGRIWCRIGWPLDRFFVFPADLRMGFELRPSSVSFYFISFLGIFVFVWGFLAYILFLQGSCLHHPPPVAGLLRAPLRVVLPLPPFSMVPGQLVSRPHPSYLCFYVVSLF
jgi:hypothetical protein